MYWIYFCHRPLKSDFYFIYLFYWKIIYCMRVNLDCPESCSVSGDINCRSPLNNPSVFNQIYIGHVLLSDIIKDIQVFL
jgi:hypothetical protein